MRFAFVIAIAGPALAGAIGSTFADAGRTARHLIHLLGLAASIAGLAFIAGTVWAEGSAEAASFHAGAWEVLLAGGIVLSAFTRQRGTSFEQICRLSAVAAAVGSVLSSDVVATSAFLIATTVALALSSVQRGNGSTAIMLALSDALAVAGLVWAAGTGMRVPPAPDAGPALVLCAAAIVRLLSDRGTAEGIVRAQAFLLGAWALAAAPDFARPFAVGAAVLAMFFARRAWAIADRAAAAHAEGFVVLALLGLGTLGARWAAALLVAGVMVAGTRRATGSVVALAATVPGLAAAAVVTMGATEDLLVMGTGLAIACAGAWLVLARTGGPAAVPAIADLLPAIAALGIAVFPGTAARELGSRIAPALGAAPPLATIEPALGNDAGIAFVLALIGVSLVVRGRRPVWVALDAQMDEQDARAPLTWLPALIVVEAAAIGWFFALLVLGVRRGFL